MHNDALFPFAAIVGQDRVKKALLITLVNQRAGGVLIGGKKGTAKSTLVRGVRELCREQSIVEVPLSITEDMLFGSIDIEHAVNKGERKFAPGVLARADQNILYLDEINLLRTELLTAILEVKAAGVNRIEREGISFEHFCHYTVIGTMNPEEGSLTSQVLDRFGLYVEADNELDCEKRVQIMRELLNFAANIEGYRAKWVEETNKLVEQIDRAKDLLKTVVVSEAFIQLAAKMCAQAFCAGHRAEIYLLECAKAIAALALRDYILPQDMQEAAQYVLPHRMRQAPGEEVKQTEAEKNTNENNEVNTTGEDNRQAEQEEREVSQAALPADNKRKDTTSESEIEPEHYTAHKTEKHESHESNNAGEAGEQVAEADKNFSQLKVQLDWGQDRKIRRGSGKRSITKTDLKQGRYVRAQLSKGKIEDLAFDATIRAAAPYQRLRVNNGCALNLQTRDLRQKVREKRIGSTFLFVVDASGSMGAQTRMQAVKGAVFHMLQEAYQKRDQVGMIAFRRHQAEILLPITRSIELAQKCLQDLPTGGKTPLAEGLAKALLTLYVRTKREQELEPVLVLITDGRANFVDESGQEPIQQALVMAEKIGKLQISAVVIDTETDFIKLGVAKDIAQAMGASYYRLQQLSQEGIIHIVKNLE
ncbi:MAG: VWA domain-containing protein [Acidaminococcaceae bacterium]